MTAITPRAIDVGLSQLVTRSPSALPTGTRPEAMPPMMAPSANGVRIDETAVPISISRTSCAPLAPDRSAYAVPRRMIPRPATKSGIAMVDAIEPNAVG